MLYDRILRSIQNKCKRIRHVNSFINIRLQRKLRKFPENSLSGFWVSGLRSHLQSPQSQVLPHTYELGLGSQVSSPTFRFPVLGFQVPAIIQIPGLSSRVPPTVSKLGSHFLDMPTKLIAKLHRQEVITQVVPHNLTKSPLFTELR